MKRTSKKSVITVLFLAILAMAFLAACGAGGDTAADGSSGGEVRSENGASGEDGAFGGDPSGGASSGGSEDGLRIVAAIFPEADWARSILGENPAGAQVITLMDSGVDPHSFQPSARDMLTISSCDVFIYTGGESDVWVEDALDERVNPDMQVVNLMEALGSSAREEEIAEGMQQERGRIDLGFLNEEEGPELDEHVWLSLRNASVLCDAVSEAIAAADPEHEDVYQKNCRSYQKALASLDQAYVRAVSAAPLDTLLFGDRFPFLYLTEDYDLNYYAAFSGCSAETEASFETIHFLAGKLDELGLPAVCVIDGSDKKIAETIIRSTMTKDQKILTLDSMQSVTSGDAKAGATYLAIMKKNLTVLRQALGSK